MRLASVYFPHAAPQLRLLTVADPRFYQIGFLGTFLLVGLLALGWQTRFWDYAVIIGVALGTQAVLISLSTHDWRGLRSALITALGLCLLLRTNSLATAGLAALVAILSKSAIRYNGKHVFNPANIGIVAAIVLTQDAWVSPGQWGHGAELVFLLAATGGLVLRRVGRLDTSAVFMGVFGGLTLLWNVLYKGWPLDFWGHQLMNGSLLLFAFFMITDPRTIPDHKGARRAWAALLAVATVLAGQFFYFHTAAIWVLFLAAPLAPLLDRWFPAQKFEWHAHPQPVAPSENASSVSA